MSWATRESGMACRPGHGPLRAHTPPQGSPIHPFVAAAAPSSPRSSSAAVGGPSFPFRLLTAGRRHPRRSHPHRVACAFWAFTVQPSPSSLLLLSPRSPRLSLPFLAATTGRAAALFGLRRDLYWRRPPTSY
ncbi:unnamed protein product [Urochloa humidicola]